MEVKPVTVTQEFHHKYLIDYVIRSIKEKLTSMKGEPIYIQQDNVRSHIPQWDEALFNTGTDDAWNVRMKNQPTNLPDVSVLGFGYFNSVQALQQKECTCNLPELFTVVENAFNDVTETALSNHFITLMTVFNKVL